MGNNRIRKNLPDSALAGITHNTAKAWISELEAGYLVFQLRPHLHFWRDSNGVEVDILIEQGDRIIPVEIKSGKTVTGEFFSGLEKWVALAGNMAINPTLIYGGAENYRHKGIRIMGRRDAGRGSGLEF